jgi:predicted DsbA family dithiol-disulfide isomerase
VADPVWLYVDPICPWCYQTARWARRLQELDVVELSWGFFSLEVQNAGEGVDILTHTRSVPALRVALFVREQLGQAAAGAVYAALGAAMHERDEQLKLLSTITASLADAGVDPEYARRALADEGTARRLFDEHRRLSERGFGVPTLVLDRPDGPAMFGPVIPRVPGDDDARELFEHTAWLIRNPNVFELKRTRTEPPDLEGLRRAQRRRAARQAADG